MVGGNRRERSRVARPALVKLSGDRPVYDTLAQPEFGICLTPFRAWLWRLEREGCFCCSPETMQHVKVQGCKKHLRPALRASRPAGELEARTRHVVYSNSQIGTIAAPGCQSNRLAWPGWRLHPGNGVAMQPGGTGRGLPSSWAIEWAHLCFLLLGSGSDDWAAWEKVATPKHQATAGCQRPWAITQDLAAALSRHHNGPFLPPCTDCVFPLWHKSRPFGTQPCSLQRPMTGRADKVGGSAILPICVALGPLTLGGSVGSVPAGLFNVDTMRCRAVPCHAIDKQTSLNCRY